MGGLLLALSFLAMTAVAAAAWNDPYPADQADANILYAAFRERPKHLDPAKSYSANEYEIIGQIYEPPFQYHYLRRPYTLVPLTATEVPRPVYLDRAGRRLPADAPANRIAYSVYEIHIRPGIYYQPHPCFARGPDGRLLYDHLTPAQLAGVYTIGDFSHTGTRELVAADYVYEIKRLANPRLHSPIYSVMSQYIVGFKRFGRELQRAYGVGSDEGGGEYIDLTRFPLTGVQVVNRYTFRITIRGKYPQFLYWMAMPFFAPMPPEADRFFTQPGMARRNITLDWYPVGTGPYMLTVNNPNRKMVLLRNPNFHDERYPARGAPGDAAAGLLADAGKRLPFINEVVFTLEKESIPYWNKFLEGYYDQSGVLAESFDQAIHVGSGGEVGLTDAMKKRGIRLLTSVGASTYYFGFNMLDPVVGGYTKKKRELRQAISIAINIEEYISIFLNGRGIPAQGPIPPGIFGYRTGCAGMDRYVYDCVDGRPQRKSIAVARRLLAEAGYPGGVSAATGQPLLLYFDTTGGGAEDKSFYDWMRKQFAKLNIQLVVRSTDYNRFQEKMRHGDAQIFLWGWNADYPDPEDFLFLLYGPDRKVGAGGENASNYENPEYDRLFREMKSMGNGPRRLAIIEKMQAILQRDAPWVWGFHPKQFLLVHSWLHNAKPNQMANNTIKYLRLDPRARARYRERWNQPIVWPLGLMLGVFVVGLVPAVVAYIRRERRVRR